MSILETEILRPRDPGIPDDDWPEFQLSSVEVRDLAGEPVSLLTADAATPVTVTGKLEPLDQSQAHLRQCSTRTS